MDGVEELLAVLGVSGYPAAVAVHRDRPHVHAHIIVSLLKDAGDIVAPLHGYRRIGYWAAAYAARHGWDQPPRHPIARLLWSLPIPDAPDGILDTLHQHGVVIVGVGTGIELMMGSHRLPYRKIPRLWRARIRRAIAACTSWERTTEAGITVEPLRAPVDRVS
jgi:protein-L-isoaspartate O-methyltransferase